MTVTDFWAGPSWDECLLADIKQMVVDDARALPRNNQLELGPSQIGDKCPRRIASYHLCLPGPNPPHCPLPAWVGTAAHAAMERAGRLANTNLKRDRFLLETKVHPSESLSGTCDCFDTDSKTVVDYKFLGTSQMQKFKAGISQNYRVQVHTYGLGFENAGHEVRHVAVLAIPRGGTLASSVMWSEAYDRRIAEAALDRFERIKATIEALDIRAHPERIDVFEKVGGTCRFCRMFSPRPQGPTECPGVDVGIHP